MKYVIHWTAMGSMTVEAATAAAARSAFDELTFSHVIEKGDQSCGPDIDFVETCMLAETRITVSDHASAALLTECTLAEFYVANPDLDTEERLNMECAITNGEAYLIGGGAAPLVEIRILP